MNSKDYQAIFCPSCKKVVTIAKNNLDTYLEIKCNECYKLVVYNTKQDITKVKPIPQRQTSSGKRFY